jgi:hypothetical protein
MDTMQLDRSGHEVNGLVYLQHFCPNCGCENSEPARRLNSMLTACFCAFCGFSWIGDNLLHPLKIAYYSYVYTLH